MSVGGSIGLNMRKFGGNDYWRIREFLRRIFRLNGLLEKSWHVARWDYWRYHGVENIHPFDLEESVFIWENQEEEIVAVLNPESPGDAILQIDPRFKTTKLVEEMIEIAEKKLTAKNSTGGRKLTVWVDGEDSLTQGILKHRRYEKKGRPEQQHRIYMEKEFPVSKPAPGYMVRPLGDIDEIPARSWLSWRAFHPDEPDDDYEGWEWYLNLQKAPLYRRALDIVAVSDSGELSSFCTFWYDDVTRTAYIEPVGTEPSHQKRGLGKAVISEGLLRLKKLGGLVAFVGGYSDAANSLYSWFAGGKRDVSEPWVRVWNKQ